MGTLHCTGTALARAKVCFSSKIGVCALFFESLGARRLQDAGALSALVAAEQPDVICLQETKLQDQHCEGVQAQLGLGPEWRCTWSCSQASKGYSGTAILTRCAQPFAK